MGADSSKITETREARNIKWALGDILRIKIWKDGMGSSAQPISHQAKLQVNLPPM